MEVKVPIIDKAKEHVKKYKIVYACTATGVVIAVITCVVMKGRYAGVLRVPENSTGFTVRSFLFFSNNNKIVTVVEREGRGHPGYITICLENSHRFPTQDAASEFAGVTPAVMSKHLNGDLPNAGGLHFAREAA